MFYSTAKLLISCNDPAVPLKAAAVYMSARVQRAADFELALVRILAIASIDIHLAMELDRATALS